jgi:hypothetical protein
VGTLNNKLKGESYRCARPKNNGNLRNSSCISVARVEFGSTFTHLYKNLTSRHVRLIEKNATKMFLVRKDFGLLRQIGTARVN